ncbi:WYL domain-containing protein [Burkholderia sp. Bp8963]|uniref:helix-turn-helix transcriptional regulator n=1 Tax=Burkholderia sp. Bp8963 TaxID=2184547 RepID=UPI000F59A2D0|nr:WYL domain-containing protein [Burkholderia sp. Bp8963]RQS72581.1 WYL domain-containing protein [Burkholderia sp. Bp8963]
MLPAELRRDLDSTTLLVGPRTIADRETVDMDDIRRTIRTERKLRVTYADARGRRSERTVWPFALGYFDDARILVTWCEVRNDFRHFRTDRIVAMERLDERYPRRRSALLKAWREAGADVRVPV